MMVSFVLSFFPRDVLDEILNLIESVSEDFPSYSFTSVFFHLQRGCRQGDPISPYIFILCVEVLGLMIRKNDNIRGIRINDSETKLSQHADDTQIFLDGSENSLRTTLTTLQKFYLMSGLQINVEKTKAVWIGAMSKSERKLCHEFKLDWNQNPLKF